MRRLTVFQIVASTLILWLLRCSKASNIGTYPVCKQQKSSCSCQTDQGLIDLSAINNQSPSSDGPYFHDVRNMNGGSIDSYFYNPCTPFSKGVSGCSGAAVCQGFPYQNPTTYYSFGDHNSAAFINDPATQKLQLKYNWAGTRLAYITLTCDKSKLGELVFDSQQTSGVLITEYMTLTSKYACPGNSGESGGGTSVGTVLCILFIALVIVYLIGGVIYMHFARGAEGIQKIPNVDFWTQVPGLVKDGVVLVVSPMRSAVSGYRKV